MKKPETISIAPHWPGMVAFMLRVMMHPSPDPVLVATYALEIGRLGTEAQEILLELLSAHHAKRPATPLQTNRRRSSALALRARLIKIAEKHQRALDRAQRRVR